MKRSLSTALFLAATLLAFNAQAVSHVGAAPMKPGDAASAPAKQAAAKKKAKKHMGKKKAMEKKEAAKS